MDVIMSITMEDVDFQKLKNANDLLLKWANRAKIGKNNFVRWAISLYKNQKEHQKSLPQHYRSAFSKDRKAMFYAMQIEEAVINQYYAMIFHIMRKLRVRDEDRDEMLSIGLTTVRHAIWQFRNHKIVCGFTTWCHNNLYMRIKGEYHKKLVRRRKARLSFNSIDEISKRFDVKKMVTNLEASFDEQSDVEVRFQQMIENAGLDESEIFMLHCFMKRHDINYMIDKKVWYSEYLKKYEQTSPTKKLTREAVRLRLIKLQKKLWRAWHRINNQSVPDFEYHGTRKAV